MYDWHFIPAAVTLKNGLGIPFVYSVDSLEDHRSLASNTPYNMAIKSIEWLGFYEAEKISVKSEWMREEIVRIYKVPKEKITVISTTPEPKWIKDVLKTYNAVAGGAKGLKHELSVMMLSWEFPPRVIGGISPHVYFLSKSLVKQGVKVYVATCDFPGAPTHEVIDGVEVYRIDSYKTPAPDFATWVYLMNLNMQRETAALTRKLQDKIDVFHAHDWLVANAGIGLKHVFRKPLLVTMHSTEMGRREGTHTTTEKMIHETEAWLTYEAWKVICCSDYMISHVKWAFGLPSDKLVMVPNGVNTALYDTSTNNHDEGFQSKIRPPRRKNRLIRRQISLRERHPHPHQRRAKNPKQSQR